MKMGKVAGATAFAAIITLAGCASIVSDSKPKVGLYSLPTNANYVIKNSNGDVLLRGVTPGTEILETSRGYFKSQSYTVTFQKEGYTETTVPLKSTVSGWYWGNLLIGGLIGMLIVDPLTGAMYTLPEDATGKLSAASLVRSSQPQASAASQ